MASSSPSSRTAHKDFFSAWAEFNSSPRSDVPLSTQLLLQKHHPSHHITRTSSSKFDLFGFAAAGHATAVLSFESPRLYNASRIYHSPKMRLVDAADPGSLSDDVDFGRWLYTYQDATFTVYRLQYLGVHGQTHKLLFVLAEDDPSTESSAVTTSPHHPRTDALLLAAAAWTHQLHNEIYVFDDSRWQKDADLWASIQGASWADVILDQSVKAGLEHDALSFFDNRALYHSLSVPWKRGIILHGVPGNGKTVSIKALINALAARSPPVPALYVKNLDSCSGDKWSIQMIFSQARKMAPCLLVLEDLDSIVRGKTRSYFLNEVDGLASNDGILMVGSTNHLGRLDDAITKRPSRFDRKYCFRVPDERARGAYARYWRGKVEGNEGGLVGGQKVEFTEEMCGVVARATEGFSFAYLKELFVTSLLVLVGGGMRFEEGEEKDMEVEEEDREGSLSTETSGVIVKAEGESQADDREEKKKGKKNKKSGDKKKRKGKKTKKSAAAPKPKVVRPTVEIPEHLSRNAFLKVLLAQAKTLFDQMDDTKDDKEDNNQGRRGRRPSDSDGTESDNESGSDMTDESYSSGTD